MPTQWGTSYFVSRLSAIHYYLPYEQGDWNDACDAVDRKLAADEIHIGVPHLKAGEKLLRVDDGLRYAIQEAE